MFTSAISIFLAFLAKTSKEPIQFYIEQYEIHIRKMKVLKNHKRIFRWENACDFLSPKIFLSLESRMEIASLRNYK